MGTTFRCFRRLDRFLIGAGLATILCILTVFERSNRVHRTVVLFPLLALLTLIFVDPMEMESPPPPERLEDILNGGQTPTESQSGSGKADPNEQGVNSGDQEKQEGQGPPPPVAVILFGDDYTPPNEVFYLRQEIQSQFNGLRLVAPTKSTIPYNAPRGFSTLESKPI